MIILISISVLAVISLYPLFISASLLDEAAERRNNKNRKSVVRSFMIDDYVYKVRYK